MSRKPRNNKRPASSDWCRIPGRGFPERYKRMPFWVFVCGEPPIFYDTRTGLRTIEPSRDGVTYRDAVAARKAFARRDFKIAFEPPVPSPGTRFGAPVLIYRHPLGREYVCSVSDVAAFVTAAKGGGR